MKTTPLLLAFLALPLIATAASYHIDARSGDDTHDGLTPATAWRSLQTANGHTFVPGDRLLLRAGCSWEAETLQPPGSGIEGKPITLDRYGEGADPALHGRGAVPYVLRLHNQEFWEIAHLEITNHSPEPGRRFRGIEIGAQDVGILHHIHLRDLYLHDVNATHNYKSDSDNVGKSFGGLVTLIEGTGKPTAWDDLRVERCRFEDIGAIGLVMVSSWLSGHRDNDPKTWCPSQRVVIRGNTFVRIARNGLLLRGCVAPLVEYNLFRECARYGSGNASFMFHCDDALFQYNEACFTRYNQGDYDASGFDSDYNSRRTVFQYNYSHDNDYGFILLCCYGKSGFNEGTIVRYNISQNDGGNLVRFAGTVKGARIYNNTLYVRADIMNPREGEAAHIVLHNTWSGWADDIAFFNNLIVNDSERADYEPGQSTNVRYDHNLFFGHHPAHEPADTAKLTVDPRLHRPGQATSREDAASVYRPLAGSAAIGAGIRPDNLPATDYAGRPIVVRDGKIDIGAISSEP